MKSTQEEVLTSTSVSQEYGDKFISLPEQDKSDILSEEQVDILLQDEDRLDEMGVSLTTNLDGEIRLKSANTVGATRLGSGRDWLGVQVIPKVGNAAFLRMIEYGLTGLSSGETETEADTDNVPTVDVVVHYFARKVQQFLHNHRHRAYEYETSAEEGRLKGRVLLGDYVRHSLPKCKPHVVPHKHVDFTRDNFPNRVIAYAVHLATQLAKASSSQISENTLDILRECRRQLAGVPVQRVTSSELRRFRFTRKDEAFETIFQLCEVIISNSSVTLGKRQRVPFFSFNLEMPHVFERYIAAIFRNAYGTLFTGRKSSLTHSLDKHGKQIELDGLYSDDGRTIVLEAKYKVAQQSANGNESDDSLAEISGLKLSRSDLYQTIAYTSHREVKADSAFIVYPALEEDSPPVRLHEEISSLGWFSESGSGTPIYPITVDLGSSPKQVSRKLQEVLEPLTSTS